MKMRRFLPLLLLCCIALPLLLSSCDNGTMGLVYEQNKDGTYTLTEVGRASDEEIVVPAQYSGANVTAIKSNAFNGNDRITGVQLPSTIETIETGAFANCVALTAINIPEKVTKIQAGTFAGCTALEQITIPDHVKTIERAAFDGCTALTSLVLGKGVEEIEAFAFNDCIYLEAIYYTGTRLEAIFDPNVSSSLELYLGESAGNDALRAATVYFYSEQKPSAEGNYWHYVTDAESGDKVIEIWNKTED